MDTTSFSINFDYRCPFGRNANEHVIAALRAGAPFDVRFVPFSLSVHNDEGRPLSIWEDPDRRDELTALAAGCVVRDHFPDQFYDAHLSLFALRHDDGEDVRDDAKVRSALERAGVDAAIVFKELEDGWPYELVRKEHEASATTHAVWGVPTFVLGPHAVFVRLMTRSRSDPESSIATVRRILDLITEHPEINEFKHTSISN